MSVCGHIQMERVNTTPLPYHPYSTLFYTLPYPTPFSTTPATISIPTLLWNLKLLVSLTGNGPFLNVCSANEPRTHSPTFIIQYDWEQTTTHFNSN